ncbi:Ig-like domain-containing protein, partial [Planctomycetota bacterium]
DGTQILGQFDANGNIYLVDSAGILFGANSQINVNQLVASSLDISNDDFLAGQYEFSAGEGDIGAIVNNGTINAADGVALIGRQILNTGTITTAEGGFVVMAAGDRVLLGEPGSHILVEMNSVALPEEGDGDVINDGHISAPAGTVVLAAGDVFASALELPKVSGGIGKVEQNGHIHVDGTTGDGGNVSLTAADEVVLATGSQTTANAGTDIDSDAGLVVIHSLGRTTIETDAQIQATGGHVPHDLLGDFDDVVETTVEISGDYVNLAGNVDASATDDKRGKIVVDALDMTVADGSMPDTPPDNTIYEEWIEAQSDAATDVELVAHSKDAGNITVEDIGDGEITGGSGDIVLRTKYDTGGITFLGDPAAIYTDEGSNVYMLAGSGGITIGDVISDVPGQHWDGEPGKIRLLTTNNGNISTGQLSVEGGSYDEISVIASGDLMIDGDVTTYAHQVDEEREVGQARTCLISEQGNVYIDGEISVEAHGKYGTTADIHIDAGQDITINLSGGQIRATAKTSSTGPANASVLIHAGKDIEGPGNILITDDGVNPTTRDNAIFLEAKPGGGGTSQVAYGDALWDVEVGAVYDEDGNLIEGSHAKLEIDDNHTGDCPECPTPPGLVPPLDPSAFTTHMNFVLYGNVLEGETGLTVIPDSWDPETAHGTLTIAENGDYEYTPDEGFVGQDRFTYKAITDKGVETDLVEVTITVVNNTPIAHDDTVTMDPGQSSVIIDVLANDSDPDHPEYPDELTVVQDSITVKHGKLILNDDNTFTYIPDPGYVGKDFFTYAVKDGQDGQELIWTTVVIWVNNVLFVFVPAAPVPEPIAIEVSGCPALVKWAAAELGSDEQKVQIWVANSLASPGNIQPCDACGDLKEAAAILQDVGGHRVVALAGLINEFASSTAPPTEEQMASIADVIANDIEGNVQYAAAGEYLDALAKYVRILNSGLGFSADESVQFATNNYVEKLVEDENVGVAAYVAARLAALGGSQ